MLLPAAILLNSIVMTTHSSEKGARALRIPTAPIEREGVTGALELPKVGDLNVR